MSKVSKAPELQTDSTTSNLQMDEDPSTLWRQQANAKSSRRGNKRKRPNDDDDDDGYQEEDCDSDPESMFQASHLCATNAETEGNHPKAANPPLKRRKLSRKYSTYCKRIEVPYPLVSRREADHLDHCFSCQETWPLYFFQQHQNMKLPFDSVCSAWMDMPEDERKRKYKMLLKSEKSWINNLIRTRPPSGYQIFLKNKREENDDRLTGVPLGSRTKIIASVWNKLSDEEKQPYIAQSEKLKQERSVVLKELTPFQRKRFEEARRNFKTSQKSKRPRKPCNPFMLYLSDRWKEAVSKGSSLKYRDMMGIASRDWKQNVSEEDKLSYSKRFLQTKEHYFLEKKEMEKQANYKKIQEKCSTKRKRRKKTKSGMPALVSRDPSASTPSAPSAVSPPPLPSAPPASAPPSPSYSVPVSQARTFDEFSIASPSIVTSLIQETPGTPVSPTFEEPRRYAALRMSQGPLLDKSFMQTVPK